MALPQDSTLTLCNMENLLQALRQSVNPDICIQILARIKADPDLLGTLSIDDKRRIVSGLLDAEAIYGPAKKIPKGKKLADAIDSINL